MMFTQRPVDLDHGRVRTSEGGRYVATIVPDGDSIPKGKLQQWTLRVVTIDSAPLARRRLPWAAACRNTGTACPPNQS